MKKYENVVLVFLHNNADSKFDSLLKNMKNLSKIVVDGKNVALQLTGDGLDAIMQKLKGSLLVKRVSFAKNFVVS